MKRELKARSPEETFEHALDSHRIPMKRELKDWTSPLPVPH